MAFNFSIIFSDPRNLYTQGTSKPLPYFLSAVTSQEIFLPWLRKYQKTLENSLGTCPTTVPSALRTATARRSWVFPASLPIRRISPTRGVHTTLNTWWPRITLWEGWSLRISCQYLPSRTTGSCSWRHAHFLQHQYINRCPRPRCVRTTCNTHWAWLYNYSLIWRISSVRRMFAYHLHS